jgi:cob(I)alamin adenosyltransferase
MVRLTKIYTRTGDGGRTALGDGRRVAKTHPRIAAYGCVDELNAVIGLVVAQRGLSREDRALLRGIQNDLFDLGADLCVPRLARERAGERLRVTPGQVDGGARIGARCAQRQAGAAHELHSSRRATSSRVAPHGARRLQARRAGGGAAYPVRAETRGHTRPALPEPSVRSALCHGTCSQRRRTLRRAVEAGCRSDTHRRHACPETRSLRLPHNDARDASNSNRVE